MGVRLRIDEVVLHGFDPRDRHAFGDVLREEVARLFGNDVFQPLAEPRVAVEVTAESVRDVAIARGVAAAIHREVRR